jgi:hypothetical protein
VGNDLLDPADAAAANQLAADSVDRQRPSQTSGLENSLVLAHGLHHQPPLADRQARRLLGIDILAGLADVDADQGVPMVGSGRDDRVHILAFQELAVVLIGFGFPLARNLPGTRQVYVGHGHDLGILTGGGL